MKNYYLSLFKVSIISLFLFFVVGNAFAATPRITTNATICKNTNVTFSVNNLALSSNTILPAPFEATTTMYLHNGTSYVLIPTDDPIYTLLTDVNGNTFKEEFEINMTNDPTFIGTKLIRINLVDGANNVVVMDLTLTVGDCQTCIPSGIDTDNDGVDNSCDLDDDNDGILDTVECGFCVTGSDLFTNGSFEQPTGLGFPNGPIAGTYWNKTINQSTVPGWQTTASDGMIEFWKSQTALPPYFNVADGMQMVELNANEVSTLYQTFCVPTGGGVLNWSIKHRGRGGDLGIDNVTPDVAEVRLGTSLSSYSVLSTMSDTNQAWGAYSGTITIPSGNPGTYFIMFSSISAAGGFNSVGNFIDNVQISFTQNCLDTDNDGITNSSDLDSDADGCSDANEYYNSAAADGNDGGVYGTGTPTGDANGQVVGAAYTGTYTNATTATQINVTTQPSNVSVNIGNNISFTVGATGINTTTFNSGTPNFVIPPATNANAGLIYQWQQSTDGGTTWTNVTNGGQFSGAIANTLTISNVALSQNGYQYQVIVTHTTQSCPIVSDGAFLTVVGSSDLSLVVATDTPCEYVGENTILTVTITNNGPNDNSGVLINSLQLPNILLPVSYTPSVGTYDSSTFTWTVGNLAVGQSVTLDFLATVNATGNDYQFFPNVKGNLPDPNITNNWYGNSSTPPFGYVYDGTLDIIVANNDTVVVPVNAGDLTVINVLNNDTVNTISPGVLGTVSEVSQSTPGTLILNADGSIDVSSSATPGTHTLTYSYCYKRQISVNANAKQQNTQRSATDCLNCYTAIVTVTITDPCAALSQPVLSAVTQPTCVTAKGSFTITNYDATYTYLVTPSTDVTILGNTITAPAGTYTVIATLGGCTSIASASVTVNNQPVTPVQPTLACYESATFNTTTCTWEVTGTQPVQPTLACYETLGSFNTATCTWDVTGTQPAPPTLACYETLGSFNTATCTWDVTGTQPAPPTLACYETLGSFNTATCTWDVTGTQPAPPTLACYETLGSFNTATCTWDVTGTQPAPPTLACYETLGAFNTATCTWDVTGTQPAPPTLACYETLGSFNATTCTWNVTGTQPAPPTLACYETLGSFNTATCTWNVTGTQPAPPTLACYETLGSFNTATCTWNVTGTQPAPPTLACYETLGSFNTATCTWDVTGTQPAPPTLACYETLGSFNATTCTWNVTGTQPAPPTLACYETLGSFNTATCTWNVTGTQPAPPTLACYETLGSFNTATCTWDVTGTQPAPPTLACYETLGSFNTATCTWDVTGTQLEKPVLSAVNQPTCPVVVGSFTITNYNAAYTYIFSPSIGVTNIAGIVTAPAGTYTVTASVNGCNSLDSSSVTVINAICAIVDVYPTQTASTTVPTTVGNVTTNDTLNGVLVTADNTDVTPVTAGPLSIDAAGELTLQPNTPSGTYPITYTICEVNPVTGLAVSPTNCASVTDTVTVLNPIVAIVDVYPTQTPSTTVPTTVGNVTTNDTLNGVPVTADNTDVTPVTAGPLSIDAAGELTLQPNTPSGTYPITYTICEVNPVTGLAVSPANCSSVTDTVTVLNPIVAIVDVYPTQTSSSTAPTTVGNVTTNDTLNGVLVTADNTDVTPATAGPLSIDAAGELTLQPNTPSGTYPITYTICEVNPVTGLAVSPANCSSVTDIVTVLNPIVAIVDVYPTQTPGTTVPTTVGNVTTNDTLNGVPVTADNTDVTPVTNGPLSIDAAGVLTLQPNTSSGTYPITYTICEVNPVTGLPVSPANCSSVIDTVTVLNPIVAIVDVYPTQTPGTTLPTTVGNVTTNDTLNGVLVTADNTDVTPATAGPLSIDAAGELTLQPNTPSGTYPITYTICEVDPVTGLAVNPTNCASVTDTVTVSNPIAAIVDVYPTQTPSTTTPTTVGNVTTNDTLNGVPVTADNTDVTPVTNGPLSIDAAGVLTLQPNTPSGTYPITYTICEVDPVTGLAVNPTNCASVTDTVTVSNPIAAIVDVYPTQTPSTTTPTTVGNVTTNDTLNGVPVTADNTDVTPVTNGPLSIDAAGELTLQPNTPSGTYPITYTICEVDPVTGLAVNPTNCASVTDTITVSNPIDAKDDGTAVVPFVTIQSTSSATIVGDVTTNDTLNGVPVTASNTDVTPVTNGPLSIDAAGVLILAPNTPSGNYTINYQLCEVDAVPSNCDTATAYVKVVIIDAVNDMGSPVTGVTGGQSLPNVLVNDTLNAIPATLATVNLTQVSTTNTGVTLNPENGSVNVAAGTPGGNYLVTYQVCDKANPTFCDTATVSVFVEAPSIAIVKTAHFNDEHTDGHAVVGETISYSFTVTNTGNVSLTNVTITDLLPGVVLTGGPITLDIGESNSTAFTASYSLTKDDLLLGSVTNQATAFGTSPLNYIVEDLSDNSSVSTDYATVLGVSACAIEVFNAVSPNEDGHNDVLYIRGLECYPDNTVEIYNRWGVLVFERDGYNNVDRAFRGVSEGRVTIKQSEELPVGTYYYIFKYRDSESTGHEKAGYLYLNR